MYLYGRNEDTIYKYSKYKYNSNFSDIPLVPWSWAWWEYLHYGNLQMPNQALTYFFVDCLDQELAKYGLWAGYLFLKIKFYWKTDMPIHFWIVFGSFPITMIELSHCNRDERPHKPEIFTVWSFKKVCQHVV